jgi:uncharacterized membrane protein YqjE
MASVHPIRPHVPAEPEGVIASLIRLARLEFELGLAESRELLVSAVIAAGVAVVAAVALIASIVVVVAGALAPLFDAPWRHLIVAGGGLGLLSLAAIAWSAWRLRTLDWPRQTLTSFEENWRWLAAQLRSRLTLR